jgi:hypothetical protein
MKHDAITKDGEMNIYAAQILFDVYENDHNMAGNFNIICKGGIAHEHTPHSFTDGFFKYCPFCGSELKPNVQMDNISSETN